MVSARVEAALGLVALALLDFERDTMSATLDWRSCFCGAGCRDLVRFNNTTHGKRAVPHGCTER